MDKNEEDWTNPDPNAPSFDPKWMYKGPDAMRPGATTGGGTGNPFIFLPTGELVWGDGVGHETMTDPKFSKFGRMLRAIFSPEEEVRLDQESDGFVDGDKVRWAMQKRALFGRLGWLKGEQVVWLWPGTDNFSTLLPKLIDKLEQDGKVSGSTRINVGVSAYYTVDQFRDKRSAVQGKLQAASAEGGRMLTRRPETPPSASSLRAIRQADIAAAAAGRGYSYAARYGESMSFKNFITESEQCEVFRMSSMRSRSA